MTSRERMITAMRSGIPDRVPVSPDISNMIPCMLTGKPFWEIYVYDNPPLGHAYLDAVKTLGIDGWYLYGNVRGGNKEFSLDEDLCTKIIYGSVQIPKDIVTKKIIHKNEDKIKQQRLVETPYGKLEQTSVYFRNAPPWKETNYIKNIAEDWEKMKWLLGDDWHWDLKCIDQDLVGESSIYGISTLSFIDFWDGIRDGGSERVIFDFYDYPELMKIIFNYYKRFAISHVESTIKAGTDEIVLQGSTSSLSLISPAIYSTFVLPLNKEIAKTCRKKNVISHLHVCGRSKHAVLANIKETDIDVYEPLEKPPNGDIDIAEIKKKYGNKVALKGNILTTGALVKGTPKDVEEEVIETLKRAGENGGFILSTGDQVGGNTPLDNLKALIETGKRYGEYTKEGKLIAFS